MRAIAACAALCLSGCAALPNTVAPEIAHLSHISQHAPFSDHPTDDGANIFGVVARWNFGHAYAELGDGLDIDRHHSVTGANGEIIGSREEFTARIGYAFTVRQ